jgi:hypothetical protein
MIWFSIGTVVKAVMNFRFPNYLDSFLSMWWQLLLRSME